MRALLSPPQRPTLGKTRCRMPPSALCLLEMAEKSPSLWIPQVEPCACALQTPRHQSSRLSRTTINPRHPTRFTLLTSL
eukprot:2350783-Pleurochrysis_carterae.AAC.1